MASMIRVTSLMDEVRCYEALPIAAKTIGHRSQEDRMELWTAGTRFLLHRISRRIKMNATYKCVGLTLALAHYLSGEKSVVPNKRTPQERSTPFRATRRSFGTKYFSSEA